MDLVDLAHLTAIHTKVHDAWLTCPSDLSPLDIDTLYAFVSVVLIQQLQELHINVQNTQAPTTGVDKLMRVALSKIDFPKYQIVSCFFDGDKLYYDRRGIARAMASAGCTDAEKRLLWPLIFKCIKTSLQ